jgi:hypothetical protein
MKAVVLTQTGGPEVLEVQEWPDPPLGSCSSALTTGLTKAVTVVIRNVILESRSAYWTAVISRTTFMFAGSSFVPVWLSTTT